MTTDKRVKTKTSIIIATISCISELGIAGATVRNITARANVNTAAINYYFGNREHLIGEALKETLRNAFDTDDIVRKPDDDYKTVLTATFNHWYNGVFQFPGITLAHFDEMVNKRSGAQTISDGFEKFISDVYEILVQHGLERSDYSFSKLKIVFGSFMSSVIFPAAVRPTEKKEDFIRLLVNLL